VANCSVIFTVICLGVIVTYPFLIVTHWLWANTYVTLFGVVLATGMLVPPSSPSCSDLSNAHIRNTVWSASMPLKQSQMQNEHTRTTDVDLDVFAQPMVFCRRPLSFSEDEDAEMADDVEHGQLHRVG
jgi:hypothetical protein